jgi:hypothetical protein
VKETNKNTFKGRQTFIWHLHFRDLASHFCTGHQLAEPKQDGARMQLWQQRPLDLGAKPSNPFESEISMALSSQNKTE